MRAAKDSPLLEDKPQWHVQTRIDMFFDTGADASDMSHVKALHSESVSGDGNFPTRLVSSCGFTPRNVINHNGKLCHNEWR